MPEFISNPTPKHAFYLSVVGCILEGGFTAMGIVGYFVRISQSLKMCMRRLPRSHDFEATWISAIVTLRTRELGGFH